MRLCTRCGVRWPFVVRRQAQRKTVSWMLQAETAKRQLQERDERIKRTKAEMHAVTKELSEKSSALRDAKAAVAALKEQVKSQLKELAATSALLPCPAPQDRLLAPR